MNEIVRALLGKRFAGREHVAVHLLHPCDEAIEIARPARLAHTMDRHARELVDAWLTRLRPVGDAACEHIDGDALTDERLGQLAHVTRKPTLDHRRVLPREEQDATSHGADPI